MSKTVIEVNGKRYVRQANSTSTACKDCAAAEVCKEEWGGFPCEALGFTKAIFVEEM